MRYLRAVIPFLAQKYLGGLRRETLIPLLLDRKTEKTIGIILEMLLWLKYRHA
jgi:hypothetical protein